MASNIPNSRLGRAIKAGIPIALVLAGGELLQGRLTIERDHGRVTLTAASATRARERPANVASVRQAKSCTQATKARPRCWKAVITAPVMAAVQAMRDVIGAALCLGKALHLSPAARLSLFR